MIYNSFMLKYMMTLQFSAKESLLLESQHKQALQKIQLLEDSSKYQRREEVETAVTQAPKFTVQLNGPTDLVEGQSAHYECRIEPYPDNNLKVEWFFNGHPLQTGNSVLIEPFTYKNHRFF